MGLLDNDFFKYLPDDPQKKEAMRAGLLHFGAAMLNGQGNFGNHLGGGLAAGAQGYQGAISAQQKSMLDQEQAKRWKLENQQTAAAIAEPGEISRIVSGLPSQQAPQASAAQSLTSAPVAPQNNVAPISALPTTGTPPTAPPQPAAPRRYSADDYRAIGDRLSASGRIDAAKPYYEQAEKMKPKLKEQRALTVDGKRVMANVYDDGRTEQLEGFQPDAEKLHFRDTGGAVDGVDPFSGKVIASVKKTQSPDNIASNATTRRGQNMVDARAQAASGAGGAEGILDDDTVRLMAEQYRAGDTSVMQNLGRGAQGAKNIIKVRQEITRQTTGAGQGGADLAARNADYFGVKAGQRTAGTRIANVEMAANEAESLIPLARDASAQVARSGLLPFGKVQVMFNDQTNDPALRQFAAANNALVNVYSRAISPSGTPTVSDKEHARKMISEAMDDRSYQAVLNQMQKEITAARSAPKAVRKAFNDEVTGKGGHGPQAAPAAYSDAEKERRYQAWKQSQGKK